MVYQKRSAAALEAEQPPAMAPVMPYPTFQFEKQVNLIDVLSLTKAYADAFFAENSAAGMNFVSLRFTYERNARNSAGFLQHPQYALPYSAKNASENAAQELSFLLPEISSSSLTVSLCDGELSGYHVWEALYKDGAVTFRSSRDSFALFWNEPAYTLTDAGAIPAILDDVPVLAAALNEVGLSPPRRAFASDRSWGRRDYACGVARGKNGN